MFMFMLGLVIGGFVAWNFPQPTWAKKIQDKIFGNNE